MVKHFKFARNHLYGGTKGLTLIELTIVLAILAIIAAILIPSFLTTMERARLRGDIQSARIIQNALDLYRAERGHSVGGADMEAKLLNLTAAGFVDARYTDIQTDGAAWVVDPVMGVVVHIGGITGNDRLHRVAASLPAEERRFVTGISE